MERQCTSDELCHKATNTQKEKVFIIVSLSGVLGLKMDL